MKHLLKACGLIVFLLFVLGSSLQAQEHYLMKGMVIVKGTGEAVPFANLFIPATAQGTAANNRGQFVLYLEAPQRRNNIVISSIGYINATLRIDSLWGKPEVNIVLTPDIKELNEVTVSMAPISPKDLIEEAIRAVPKNYRTAPYRMEYYSNMICESPLTGTYQQETILSGHSQGYGSKTRKYFQITERRSSGTEPAELKAMEYDYWPSYELHSADLVETVYGMGILNLKNLPAFELTYSGIALFDQDTVFRIDYSLPNPTKAITGFGVVPSKYAGALYITTTSHAIIKHELVNDHFTHTVIYKKIEDNYFPYYFQSERTLMAKRHAVRVTNSLTLNSLLKTDSLPEKKNPNEFKNALDVPYHPEFWDTHYPVK